MNGDGKPASLRVGVLGRLTVWRDGVPVPLGAPGQRVVLGLLALHPNAALHRETIIDVLWGEEPPGSAVAVIQSYVSRLRGVLDPGRRSRAGDGVLASDGVRYWLNVDEDRLDLLGFQSRARAARRALTSGDAGAACEAFAAALDLWRGDPVADIDVLRDHPAAAGLAQARAALVAEYAGAAFGLGWHERVLPHLAALARREPLNELAHARLMFALAGSGRQAESLEVFEGIRRRLDEELGVQPGAELTAAHARVLRQEVPAAVLSPAVMAPAAAGGVCQLPPAVADFTGRAEERAALMQMITPGGNGVGVPAGVVSGPPGAGKTALALQVAHAARELFPDGQLWVTLEGASGRPRDPEEVLGELLRSLGVHGSAIPAGLAERAALYRSRLAGRRVLLVADDAASVAQVTPLLPGTAGNAVIVTSRAALAGLAGAGLVPLGELDPAEAAAMVARILGPGRAAAEPGAVDDLARACGLLPLALRIAAAKLAARPSWPVAVMVGKLTDERRRLDELQTADVAIRPSLALSYQALNGAARRAFRLLGLLGPAEVGEWVVAALLGEPDAAGPVTALTDKSLLSPAGTGPAGEPRYRLHDLLRAYATERLADEPQADQDAALERALRGWLELAYLASGAMPREPFFPPASHCPGKTMFPAELSARLTADPVAWFNAERLNLLAMTERACATGRHELAAQLASCQSGFHYYQSRYDDAKRMWQAITDAARRAGDISAVASARLHAAAATVQGGYDAEAMDNFNESIEIFERAGDHVGLAYALYWRSYCAWNLEFFGAARSDARRGVALARETGHRHAELMNLRTLGVAHSWLGEHEAGIAACEKALSIAHELGESAYETQALANLAQCCTKAGQYERAIILCRRRLTLDRDSGDIRGEALGYGMLGDAFHGLGRYHEAVEALSQALLIFRDSFMRRHHALCLLKLGYAHEAMGQPGQAIEYFEKSLPIFRELRAPRAEERARQAVQRCLASWSVT
jgi:DNA-binding SARP family transcriptional activator/tetratricopeptide (TPR) repeat protein